MRILYSPVFIVCVALFLLHQMAEKVFDLTTPFVDSYLDSLLAPPILLTLVVAERRILFRRGPGYTLEGHETFIGTLVIAMIGELLFPFLSDNFIFDWLDFLFYGVGGGMFYFWINRSRRYAE